MHPKIKKLLEEHKKLYRRKRPFSPTLENLIYRVMDETGIEKDLISGIVSAQFSMVKDTIMTSSNKDGLKNFKLINFKSIRLIYLGAFAPSKFKFNKIVRRLEKEEKENV